MLSERFIVDRLKSKRLSESVLGVHSQLNPAIFSANKMKPAIRKKFVDIVNAFLEYVEVDTKVYDIILVGSNAAYTYNEHSDIDIHIVVDLSSISNPDSIARLYFDSIKKNFKDSYDIKVKGANVELYVEDIKTSSNSSGVYSIMSDEWIKYPELPNMPDKITLNTVEETKNGYIELINNTESLDDLENILDDLYILRKESLMIDGEFGTGNLLFKALRNEGILDELKNKINRLTSQELSLEGRIIEGEDKVETENINEDSFYHSTDSPSFPTNFDKCYEIGYHVGTLEQAKDRGHKYIYELKLRNTDKSLETRDYEGWASMEFIRDHCESIEEEAKTYAADKNKYQIYSRLIREDLISRNYNYIVYENTCEGAVPAPSYIILDLEDVISYKRI